MGRPGTGSDGARSLLPPIGGPLSPSKQRPSKVQSDTRLGSPRSSRTQSPRSRAGSKEKPAPAENLRHQSKHHGNNAGHDAAIVRTSTADDKVRCMHIMQDFKIFKDLDIQDQRILLDQVWSIQTEEGTVLFQQYDPPGSCYVLIKGTVDVLVKTTADDDEQPKKEPETEQPADGQPAEEQPEAEEEVKEVKEVKVEKEVKEVKEEPEEEEEELPFSTVDGFSRFGPMTQLGMKLATCQPIKFLGDIALLNDMPRTATLLCSSSCEFLVITRESFDRTLKESMNRKDNEKLRFLCEHMPGMKEVPMPKPGTKPHPSYFFKPARYTRGHLFLTQGHVAPDNVVMVVVSGMVEFSRTENRITGPGLGRVGSETFLGSSASPPSRLKRAKSMTKLKGQLPPINQEEDPLSRRGVLVCGGVFGSLPVHGPEPFTVRVVSPSCEVYYLASSEFHKLPKKLLDHFLEYIAASTSWRLTCHERSLEFRKFQQKRAKDLQMQGLREAEERSEHPPRGELGRGRPEQLKPLGKEPPELHQQPRSYNSAGGRSSPSLV